MYRITSKASTEETWRAGRFIKQILFWLKLCTWALCATFPFWCKLKAGHAASMIRTGQNHTELEHLGMWLARDFLFLLWVVCSHCTEAVLQALSRGWSPSVDVWKNIFLVPFPEKNVYRLQQPWQSQLNTKINADKEPLREVAGIMEKQVVDALYKPIHHHQGERHPDICFQKLFPAIPGRVFIERPWKLCLIYFIRSLMQQQKHQIPGDSLDQI